MTESDESAGRSYGCSFACGNPYDYVLIDVASSETQFLCLPCFVRLTADMVKAVTEPGEPGVVAWLAALATTDMTPAPGPSGKPRGRNAPVGNDDPALFEAFDGVMTVDDLPEEFR